MTHEVSHEHYRKFDAWARARAGLHYGYGGAFTNRVNAAGRPIDSTDCSGLVLQSGAYLIGRTDWPGQRYGSTESFRLDYKIVYDLGFRRMPRGGVGSLSFKPLMLVGLQHGGGGIYSHTACTVRGTSVPGGSIGFSERGCDWESQGAGVFYYNGARAWNNSLFHDFWYLDAKLAAVTATDVINEIDAEAKRAGAWIGARVTEEADTAAGDGGKYVDFSGGRIYWSPRIRGDKKSGDRAVAVPAHIVTTYDAAGSSAGPLGYPILRHTVIDGVGDIQAFERGVIYRRFGQPGYIVHGAILERFKAAGFEKGWGWPVSNEQPTADGGRQQTFSKGITAMWHKSGVVTIKEG